MYDNHHVRELILISLIQDCCKIANYREQSCYLCSSDAHHCRFVGATELLVLRAMLHIRT